MKHYLFFIFLIVIFSIKPTPTGKGQSNNVIIQKTDTASNNLLNKIPAITQSVDSLDIVKKLLFKEQTKNQVLINKRVRKRPPEIVKIKPVLVPVVIPIPDSSKVVKEDSVQDTSLANDYLKTNPQPIQKKETFFQRLFHHKKPTQ